MAFLIGNTAVIDNSRNLANIATFDSTVQSPWDSITRTSVNKTLVNREWCVVGADNLTLTLPGTDYGGNGQGVPSSPLDVNGWEIQITVGNFTNTTILCPTVTTYQVVGGANNPIGTAVYGTINGTSDTSLIIDVPYTTIRLMGDYDLAQLNSGSPRWRIL